MFNHRTTPNPQQPVFAVIDTETTGLNPEFARIVEVGVSILNADFIELSRWETLINPQKRIVSSKIHGITNAMIKNAPTFSEIYAELANVLDGKITIAHNAGFDAGFLDAAAVDSYRSRNAQPRAFGPGWIDSLDLARQWVPQGPYRLDSLLHRYNLTNTHAHSAGADAAAVGVLLSRMFGRHTQKVSRKLVKSAPQFHEYLHVQALNLPRSATLPRERRAVHPLDLAHRS